MKLTFSVALLGASSITLAAVVPSRARVAEARAVAAPAIPTSTLVSDFKKGNVSAQWAPGHPMQWGTEDKKYLLPDSYYNAALSDDEKYIAIANNSAIQVLSFPDFTPVSTPKQIFANYSLVGTGISVLYFHSTPSGRYDVLAGGDFYNQKVYLGPQMTQIRLSKDLNQLGDTTDHAGRFTSFEGFYSVTTTPFSSVSRHFLTSDRSDVTVYDLDDSTYNLTLHGHTDSVMSAVFSPDGKYIATAAWDGFGKLWDATTGKLVHDFGPYKGKQNWLARFSPDGKQVIISVGGRDSNVTIFKVDDLAAEPVILGPNRDWVRSIEYSPDGKYLATGEYGWLRIYKTSDWSVVQTWESEDRQNWEIYQLTWLDGGKKLTYRILGGLEMYDFETNLKYRWGPGDDDHFNGGGGTTWVSKSNGWIGGLSPDGEVRLWKYPV